MMMISANGVQYHVEVTGKGAPLLLLHGFTGDTTTWKSIVNVLAQQYQCIGVDIIGHGKSESPQDVGKYKIEHVAHDLKEIVNQLGFKKVHVLGYSMGGRLALSFALLHSDYIDTLILESASPGLKNEQERKIRIESDQKLAHFIEAEGIEKFVEFWENIPMFTTQKQLPTAQQLSIRKQRLQQNPIGLANSLRGMGTGSQPSWWNYIETLPFSVLLLVGGKDLKFCDIAEEMQELNKNIIICKIDCAGHAIHVEQPQKFGTIVNEFLSTT
jgi:2-succinyl-6-hydroxy-2,4-cyclohexadiene-1-carboxylate synthase